MPFRHIITSPAVIALIFAQLGHNFGFFIIVTDLPKYMNDVLKFSIKENGLYSSLPYVCMWVVAQSTGFLSDWLIVKNHMSITNVRKLFTAIGMHIMSLFMKMNATHNFITFIALQLPLCQEFSFWVLRTESVIVL